MLSNKYLSVYNISQTPYPLYDKDLTDLFWPQSFVFGSGDICQPSGLVPINAVLTWKPTEKNLTFEFTPFANCQGIPIIFINASSSNINASAILIKKENIIIDLEANINYDSGSLGLINVFSGKL